MRNEFEINSDFSDYTRLFLEENSKHNLISKNEEKLLFEKHIYDSLSIKLFFDKYGIREGKILDIGCGGGFPCVPVAIEFPNLSVTGIDSIGKKISCIENIKNGLGLKNLELICGRAENQNLKGFDIVVSRAVADLSTIIKYAKPALKKDGVLIAYKSKKAEEEIREAKEVLTQYKSEVFDIIEYNLPLEELYIRNLICIRFNK